MAAHKLSEVSVVGWRRRRASNLGCALLQQGGPVPDRSPWPTKSLSSHPTPTPGRFEVQRLAELMGTVVTLAPLPFAESVSGGAAEGLVCGQAPYRPALSTQLINQQL